MGRGYWYAVVLEIGKRVWSPMPIERRDMAPRWERVL